MTDMLKNMPPQNLEAEVQLLGALLVDPAYSLPKLRVRTDDLYPEKHRSILSAIHSVHAAGLDVDIITVSDELRRQERLDKVGGASYLAQLISETPSAAGFESHQRLVLDCSLLRQVIHACGEAVSRAYDRHDPEAVITACIAGLNDARLRQSSCEVLPYSEVIKLGWEYIEWGAMPENAGKLRGITSGHRGIDEITSGFQKGQFCIIAARTGKGKTAFADGMARSQARAGHTVGKIQLEMMPEQDAVRAIASESGVAIKRLITGRLHEQDWGRMAAAGGALSPMKIYSVYSAFTAAAVQRAVNTLVQGHGCEIVYIDYLQLMSVEDHDGTREQEVSRISRMLKQTAKTLRIPVVALAQLSRAVESRLDKRPILPDLRESGSLEQDADLVAFIHHDECKCPPPPTDCSCGNRYRAWYLQRKGRMSGTGDVELAWEGRTTTFRDRE